MSAGLYSLRRPWGWILSCFFQLPVVPDILDLWYHIPLSLWASQVALVVKKPPTSAGEHREGSSIPGLGRCSGGGHGNPLQCSYLENPMDRGAWRTIVHRVIKSQTWFKWLAPMHTSPQSLLPSSHGLPLCVFVFLLLSLIKRLTDLKAYPKPK